ncbi:putative GTP-binding protein YPTC5 [Blattamonas nauphoetae]|uniref:GTP-binding protein YPTC5 n=1 Tax=Blattamonas nauphoetae TaxID=2049346 RepID=A0ABQ9Y0C1_9EUKA|nr:putative GTP-binding protein YPTC5 [Blattamonas nauphoetae]
MEQPTFFDSTINNKVTLKVVFIGDCNVGKTSLLEQYIHKTFKEQYKATLGTEFYTQELLLDDIPVLLQIWDTAGQERFKTLSSSYFRGADACCLVFDVNTEDSFNNIRMWHDFFLQSLDNDQTSTFPFVIVGNKIDLNPESRLVSSTQAEELSQSLASPYKYFDASAKTAQNVEDVFVALAQLALQKKQQEEPDVLTDTLKVETPAPIPKQSSTCC